MAPHHEAYGCEDEEPGGAAWTAADVGRIPLIPDRRDDAPQPSPMLVYTITHLGLVVDVRDGGALFNDIADAAAKLGDSARRLEVATYCNTSYMLGAGGAVCVKRSTKDAGHTLVIDRRYPNKTRITTIFLSPGDGADPATLPDLWRLATAVWCKLMKGTKVDPRWLAIQSIDWSTAPTEDGRAAA